MRSGDPAMVVTGVNSDSRTISPGELFLALKGDRFDGHEFVVETIRKGAIGAVVERGCGPKGLSNAVVLETADSRRALGDIAARYREDFDLPVVAVVGSNGKTTTKELIASVLRELGPSLCSEASFNNDIGVPLTLLRLESSHQSAVIEVGTNHPGELQPLLERVQPRYGVITSIGREHLEFFGDLDAVVREEGTIGEILPPDGVLFVPGDSPHAEELIRRSNGRAVRVGTAEHNEWQLISVHIDADGTVFRVRSPWGLMDGEYRISLLGRHQAMNAVMALAMGTELGLSREQCSRALAACAPIQKRLQLFENNGVRILDDSYNANADSMSAALRTLLELPCEGRRMAVLGEMAELGIHSEAAHREVGRLAALVDVSHLYVIGTEAAPLAEAARQGGMTNVNEFRDTATAGEALCREVQPGDLVLIKASRAARLERISEMLRGRNAAGTKQKTDARNGKGQKAEKTEIAGVAGE